MARRVYLSFLGTSKYQPCTYAFEGDDEENLRFVQIATLRLFCQEWNTNDRGYIFVTDQAKKANWLDDGHKDWETGEIIKCEGLSTCIETDEFNFKIEPVKIPFGVNEDEIWDIFQTVFDCLQEGDEIIFDITHSFRSIPMLAIVVLNYAKVVKKVKLSGIYYGAFEARNEQNIAPILDLTAFDELLAWSQAIDRFLDAGDAGTIAKLADKSVREFQKKIQCQNEGSQAIKNIALTLKDFTDNLSTCRAQEICSVVEGFKNYLKEFEGLEGIDDIKVKPFLPLLKTVANQLDSFNNNVINDGIQAAKWCFEQNMIQQGFTILQEIILSFFVLEAGAEYNDLDQRNIASGALNIKRKNYENDIDEWFDINKNNIEATQKYLDIFTEHEDLAEEYVNLQIYRNDINHASFNKDPKKPKAFINKLKKVIPWTIKYFKEKEENQNEPI